MVPVEDMKSCIQEWFAQEYTLEGVGVLYFELRQEIEKQLHVMTHAIAQDMHDNGLFDKPKED